MLIIFDVDGTLIDANELDHRCFDEAFLEVTGVPLPGERWSQVREFTAQAIVREGLHDWPDDERSAAETTIRAGFLARLTAAHATNAHAFPPVPGGPALIEELAASPTCRVAIATGCWRETSRFKLAAAGYRMEGVECASSSDCYRRVDIIRTVMNRLGGNIHDTVYVGDQLWDLRAANELGIRFVGVGRQREQLRSDGAETLDTLSAAALLRAVDKQASAKQRRAVEPGRRHFERQRRSSS
jgi:phosphoglycolate phosphatase-like HAD superfamily hydrolase